MKLFVKIFCLLVLTGSLIGCSERDNEIEHLSQTVYKFYEVLIDPEHKLLADLVSDSLSYGHSSGTVENKKHFVESLLNGNSNFLSVNITNQQIRLIKNVAVVRHNLSALIEDKDKPQTNINLHILMVWVKIGANWVLVARQSVRT
jgi:hypothetical protein